MSLVGGSAPYREAVTARLIVSGIETGEDADVLVIYCTTNSRLDEGESFVATRNGVPVGELTPLSRLRFVTAE